MTEVSEKAASLGKFEQESKFDVIHKPNVGPVYAVINTMQHVNTDRLESLISQINAGSTTCSYGKEIRGKCKTISTDPQTLQ